MGDLLDATDKAAHLVGRGRAAYDEDVMPRLAGEAILGRIGDAADKLARLYGDELPEDIPRRDVIDNRILVDHVYYRIDYDVVWATLVIDVPSCRDSMIAWARERDLLPADFPIEG